MLGYLENDMWLAYVRWAVHSKYCTPKGSRICSVNSAFQSHQFSLTSYIHTPAKVQIFSWHFHIYLVIVGSLSKTPLLGLAWNLDSTFLHSTLLPPTFMGQFILDDKELTPFCKTPCSLNYVLSFYSSYPLL